MLTADQILIQLREIAGQWTKLALLFHVYFGVIAVALIGGVRPSQRAAGRILAVPLLSVSAIAWVEGNPFNGIVFAVLWIFLLIASGRLPKERIRIAPAGFAIPGILLFLFGWAYPHFLETRPIWAYLYLAPTGLIPCPTLSILTGLVLILDGLGSRTICLVLGLAGLLYGAIGVFRLSVAIDAVLILGAFALLAVAFAGKRTPAGPAGTGHK